MPSDQRVRTPMFVDKPDTGLVLSSLRRYNLFTAAFFLGRQRRLLTEFADRCGLAPGEDVLDIGCGPGKLVRVLGRRVGSGGTVTGVDPSAEAIAYNQRRDPRNRYLRAAAQELAFPDASFDVVTCTFVMHHIPEEHRVSALAEMYRVLRPGGRLLLADAHPSDSMRKIFAWGDHVRGKDPADHFTNAEIRRYSTVLAEIGFTKQEFVVSGYNTGMLVLIKPQGAAEQ